MGKALYLGASSMYAWQFAKMLYKADEMGLTRFVSMQNHYNLIYREEEREMLPLCREEGIAVIPWSPLARGFVMGNRRREDYGDTVRAKTDTFGQDMYYQPCDFDVVDRITEVARKRGVSNAQVALAWMLQQPGRRKPHGILGPSARRTSANPDRARGRAPARAPVGRGNQGPKLDRCRAAGRFGRRSRRRRRRVLERVGPCRGSRARRGRL